MPFSSLLENDAMEPSPDSRPQPLTIARVVFTGDVFRVAQDEQVSHQLSNVFWLHNLLAYQLTQITELLPEIRFRTHNYKNGNSLIREAYKLMDLETSSKGWQNSFWYEDFPNELIELFRTDYDSALVLAFELSPIMECILNRLGCPWINVALSPIRFLDDILLSIRLSGHFNSEPLLPFVVSQKDIRYGADYVCRWFRSKRFKTELKDTDVVFFAQSEGDRTLITSEGSFFSAEEAVARVADLVGKRRLWIKPHPYGLENPVIQIAMERLGGQLIGENAYGILSADEDIDVVTISSSVGCEAPWFGKRTHLFNDCLLRRNEQALTIRDDYCFSDFWRVLLEQTIQVSACHRTGRVDVRHPTLRQVSPSEPNVIRKQLGFWGMPADVWPEKALGLPLSKRMWRRFYGQLPAKIQACIAALVTRCRQHSQNAAQCISTILTPRGRVIVGSSRCVERVDSGAAPHARRIGHTDGIRAVLREGSNSM
jgi:hypothetical protein